MNPSNEVDPFAGMEKAKANWVKFSKVGDFVKGTLLSKREIPNKLSSVPGAKTRIYEIRAHVGSFHTTDELKNVVEPAVTVNANEFWIVSGKESIDNALRNVALGTVVGFRLKSITPSKTKGFNPSKNIDTMIGGLDPEYMGETADSSQA